MLGLGLGLGRRKINKTKEYSYIILKTSDNKILRTSDGKILRVKEEV